ncbi:hypothetical protein SAMN05444287_0401 [Octadecabacter temperatus]|uniref:Uncharacterized protein n=1 Tax=Octadecabacter temperatus TaxID=1458307 RepID=A0A0K0Y2Y2_9RHOB|nr:hypothetical protein [Octadecabacter temperatus]AKS45309.1 hypothetical protein OSB_07480 [Octadecabacter temperatus]SIN90255.1 hypothetical protein SAMN05444287_0401 [Octadecabacter temperatus]
MITSRYPVWRTNPAGFRVAGHLPILTGTLAVLIGPVILGTIIVGLTGLFTVPITEDPQASPVLAIETIGILLVASPLVSWCGLLAAIPLSAFAAARGFAGWGVAVLGGFLTGLLAALVMNGFAPSQEAIVIGCVGVTLAVVYWGAIRFVHPTAIGVGLKAPLS